MKHLPSVFIILSFIAICIGAWLRSQNSPYGLTIIQCGFASEGISILINRIAYDRRQKNAKIKAE